MTCSDGAGSIVLMLAPAPPTPGHPADRTLASAIPALGNSSTVVKSNTKGPPFEMCAVIVAAGSPTCGAVLQNAVPATSRSHTLVHVPLVSFTAKEGREQSYHTLLKNDTPTTSSRGFCAANTACASPRKNPPEKLICCATVSTKSVKSLRVCE